MAEDDSITKTETTEAVAPVKKTRAPRQKKDTAAADVITDVGAISSEPLKAAGTRGKKAKAAPAKIEAAPRAIRAKRTPKVETAPEAADGFDDLVKLERENQSLRKQLAVKLRGENADLRKKLGTV